MTSDSLGASVHRVTAYRAFVDILAVAFVHKASDHKASAGILVAAFDHKASALVVSSAADIVLAHRLDMDYYNPSVLVPPLEVVVFVNWMHQLVLVAVALVVVALVVVALVVAVLVVAALVVAALVVAGLVLNVLESQVIPRLELIHLPCHH